MIPPQLPRSAPHVSLNPSIPLVVTGMHRSGTSFVASLLHAWKVRMGDQLLPADRENSAGYFEDVDFLELNRRILITCTPPEPGHRDWGWTESGTFDAGKLAAYRDAAASLVAARQRAGVAWGWKDPRTSMLLDFWDEVLGEKARFLLLYRHPWEVANSMLRSGAEVWLTHPDYPARIWTQYNRRILEFHRQHRDRTLLVSTNRLMRDAEAFAELMQRSFGVEADARTVATLRAQGSFVSHPDSDPLPRLWRHTNSEAIALLGALDDAADLSNDRAWEMASRIAIPRAAERPRLSVVIPCHDDGDYLIDAVASVERNAFAAELIVVDDGSTQPRTLEVLAALREAGHRVIEQPHSGLSAARNRGIAAAAGDYFLPLDADNRLLPGFAGEAVALLDADASAGVVYGDRREFGARNGDVTVPELDVSRLLWSNYIDACAVVRRAVWSEAGGYAVELHDWEDWDFWLSAAERGWRFLRLSRATFEYRIRPGSLHHRFLQRADHAPDLRRLYARHRALVAQHAPEVLLAGHAERRQLFNDAAALRTSRDVIQVEIDRLAPTAAAHGAALQDIVNARDAELASIKPILAARDEELESMKLVLQARENELAALRDRTDVASPIAAVAMPANATPENARLTNATRVFTIVARNYLAHARVLAASLARHNPGVRLQVVLLDDVQRSVAPEASFDIVYADELPFDPPSDFYTMAAIYEVTEMATAVKPWAFAYLFARGASACIYLDPDIEVFDSLGPLESLVLQHGMLLTPHATEPLPQDGKRPDDRDMLLSGVYNLGFLALSATTATTVLPWWSGRLRRMCLNDPAHGLFVDQRWLDVAPALFDPEIVKDPGYNVAYWNLPHRVLTRDGDRILVNGRPLRFFHYSGFSPRKPHLLSKHQHIGQRIRLSETPLLAELCERYSAALNDAGFLKCASFSYAFAATATGLVLDERRRRVLRRTYLDDEPLDHSASFPNPFSPDGADDVIQRLLRPAPDAPGVACYLAEIWSERADLRIAFPHIDFADTERFLEWVRTQGIHEHEIPPQLVPLPPRASSVTRPLGQQLTFGVNVYGYAFAESGTGQIVRSVVAALAAEGIPYAVVPFKRTMSRQQRVFDDLGAAIPSFDTNLICVNADQVPVFFESMREQLQPEARNIGLWAWEVDDLPAAMANNERYLDEVWGISSFTAAALKRALTRPVRAFPLPVVVPAVRSRTRAELAMPEGFLFLFCFDYDSVFQRKNPLAIVAAFRQAFDDDADVVLYIKTTNAERHAADDEELRAAAAGRSNIVIRDSYVTSDDYFSMLDSCDCYVSLHRSEGFGLTVAEAMALGKPVISTAYSSTEEFANASNSFPVPAQLIEVGVDAPPYPPHSHWAEPDIAIAAEQMARVYSDRPDAAAVGARARVDIAALHGPSARGPLLRRLLEDRRMNETLPAEQGATTAVGEREPLVEPSRKLPLIQVSGMERAAMENPDLFEAQAAAAESLLGSPRANLPSRLQRFAEPVRRLILRVLRVYWVQQLAVDRAILQAMRTLRREGRREVASHSALLARQSAEQERIAAETALLREQLTELAADVRALHQRVSTSSASTSTSRAVSE
jgi:glycosyltransferase involved in cell wall biosynthesis/GT2 family glycosyltransferase